MSGFQNLYHGENGGTLGMVPLIINPIYTPYIVGIYWDLWDTWNSFKKYAKAGNWDTVKKCKYFPCISPICLVNVHATKSWFSGKMAPT